MELDLTRALDLVIGDIRLGDRLNDPEGQMSAEEIIAEVRELEAEEVRGIRETKVAGVDPQNVRFAYGLVYMATDAEIAAARA
jgi:hypothetical protein